MGTIISASEVSVRYNNRTILDAKRDFVKDGAVVIAHGNIGS